MTTIDDITNNRGVVVGAFLVGVGVGAAAFALYSQRNPSPCVEPDASPADGFSEDPNQNVLEFPTVKEDKESFADSVKEAKEQHPASHRTDYTTKGVSTIVSEEAYNAPVVVPERFEHELSFGDFVPTPEEEEAALYSAFSPEGVYPIVSSEFGANQFDLDQQSLIWYDTDSLLTDTDEKAYPNAARLEPMIRARVKNMVSGDPDDDLIYIRDMTEGKEFEIHLMQDTVGDSLYDQEIHSVRPPRLDE